MISIFQFSDTLITSHAFQSSFQSSKFPFARLSLPGGDCLLSSCRRHSSQFPVSPSRADAVTELALPTPSLFDLRATITNRFVLPRESCCYERPGHHRFVLSFASKSRAHLHTPHIHTSFQNPK